jgi:hypothetical protein
MLFRERGARCCVREVRRRGWCQMCGSCGNARRVRWWLGESLASLGVTGGMGTTSIWKGVAHERTSEAKARTIHRF